MQHPPDIRVGHSRQRPPGDGLLVYRHGGSVRSTSRSSIYDSEGYQSAVRGQHQAPTVPRQPRGSVQASWSAIESSGRSSLPVGSKRPRESSGATGTSSADDRENGDHDEDVPLSRFLVRAKANAHLLFPNCPRVRTANGGWTYGALSESMIEERRKRKAYQMWVNSRKRCVGPNTLFVEPRLSIRAILTTVFAQLRLPPLSLHEAATHVQRVAQQPHVMFPLANCVHGICVARGLAVQVLSRDDIRARGGVVLNGELALRSRVLLIFSKAENILAAAYVEWPHGVNVLRDRRSPHGAIRLLCSAHQPRPWHRRVRRVEHIDRNETVAMFVSLRSGSSARKTTSASYESDGARPPRHVPSPAPSVAVGAERSAYRQRNAPILPVLLEANESYEDPFLNLPKASDTIIESMKALASKRQNTWTQRLLGRFRETLYKQTQSQKETFGGAEEDW